MATTTPAAAGLQVRQVAADDPLLRPMLADLARDYAARYPGLDIAAEMDSHPAADFAPPSGAFLALLDGDEVVAGGAYYRLDAGTAELKRVWTSGAHRRRGLAGALVTALEEQARAAGYRRVFLTTGPRQPEARALYLSLGYRPLGDHDEIVRQATTVLPFEKWLDDPVKVVTVVRPTPGCSRASSTSSPAAGSPGSSRCR